MAYRALAFKDLKKKDTDIDWTHETPTEPKVEVTITSGIEEMNRVKAYKKVARKIARAKPCPFCGTVPRFDCRVEESHSKHGSIGHYAVRKPCCPATSSGQTELFFRNDWKPAGYGPWKSMVDRLINNWNQRV